jgi:hypothetical protein
MRKAPVLLSLALVASAALAVPADARPARLTKPVKHGYVINDLLVPTTNDQARAYAIDVDRDGEVENQFGSVLATLASQGLEFQSPMDVSIATGAVVMLLSVQTTSLQNARGVKVRLFRGVPKASPDLNGGGRFRVDKTAPKTELKARIKNRAIRTRAGNVSVSLPPFYPGLPDIRLDLVRGRIEGSCKAKRCVKGKIGGALTSEDVDAHIIPALGAMARAYVAADCPTTPPDDCPPNSAGSTMLNLFDANDDKVITDQEVRENSLIQSLLAPDLDLDRNGVRDALSVGFGFTARWAKIRGD